MPRPVDAAMAAGRPEKATVRQLWVEAVVAARAAGHDELPLYLTLPGARGGDIEALVNAGVVRLAENGAIAAEDLRLLIAVESSNDAVLALQRRWKGLNILQERLENLLRSTSLTAWPTGEHRRAFSARVVNFDLDEPLTANLQAGQLMFPVIALIRKVAQLHAGDPPTDWTLCLTLHGDIVWSPEVAAKACSFLAANFGRDSSFSDAAREVLGAPRHQEVRDGAADTPSWSDTERQSLLMVLVPKRIAADVHRDGWRVRTLENLRYGSRRGHAPMVTWVLRFEWDDRAGSDPDLVYRDALSHVLVRCGSIDAHGAVSREIAAPA